MRSGNVTLCLPCSRTAELTSRARNGATASSSGSSARSRMSSRRRTWGATLSRRSACMSSTLLCVGLRVPSLRSTLADEPAPAPSQEAATVSSLLQTDSRLLSALRAELEQSLTDLTKTTLLIEGFKAPQSPKAHEAKAVATFPYEFFRRKADEMKDRVARYKATMDVRLPVLSPPPSRSPRLSAPVLTLPLRTLLSDAPSKSRPSSPPPRTPSPQAPSSQPSKRSTRRSSASRAPSRRSTSSSSSSRTRTGPSTGTRRAGSRTRLGSTGRAREEEEGEGWEGSRRAWGGSRFGRALPGATRDRIEPTRGTS